MNPSPGFVAAWSAVIRRRWPIGLSLLVGITGLSVVLVLVARPIWRAETALRLGAPAPMGGVSLGGGGSPAGLFTLFQQMSGDPFANELELLASRTVVEGVVADNALHVTVDAPRGWHRDSLFVRLTASIDAEEETYEATWLPNGRISVRRTSPDEQTIGDFAPGEMANFGPIVAEFRPRRPGMPEKVDIRTIPFGEAVRTTRGRLTAERKRREANLVQIRYDSPDPGLALAVVESATRRFMALRTELQDRESGQTTDSLRTVAERTMAEIRRVEADLEAFQRTTGFVAPEAQSEAFVERHAGIAAALEAARAERSRLDDVVRRLDATPDPGQGWAGLVAHPAFLQNQTLGDLLTQLVTLEQNRIELSARRTGEDREMRALEAQIAYLDGSLRSLVRQYRDGVTAETRLLEAQLAELDSALASTPAAAIELGRHQRDLRLLSEVYLFTDQRLRQEDLRGAISFASVQTVDPPAVLYRPVWPRKRLGVAVGGIIAMVFAVLGMALADRLDGSVGGPGPGRTLPWEPGVAPARVGANGSDRVEAPWR